MSSWWDHIKAALWKKKEMHRAGQVPILFTNGHQCSVALSANDVKTLCCKKPNASYILFSSLDNEQLYTSHINSLICNNQQPLNFRVINTIIYLIIGSHLTAHLHWLNNKSTEVSSGRFVVMYLLIVSGKQWFTIKWTEMTV